MDFRTLFEPKTMAVVGLSHSNERHPANIIYNKNYFRYPVKVYGVNPKGGMYHKEKIYRSISEIPEKIDLAIVAVRAEHVPGVMRECIDSWVGAAAVISGGFAETGRHDLREQFVEIASGADFPIFRPQLPRNIFLGSC